MSHVRASALVPPCHSSPSLSSYRGVISSLSCFSLKEKLLNEEATVVDTDVRNEGINELYASLIKEGGITSQKRN